MFKSKHKLDLSLVSMDQRYVIQLRLLLLPPNSLNFYLCSLNHRGKMLFAYSDTEFTTMGGYEVTQTTMHG